MQDTFTVSFVVRFLFSLYFLLPRMAPIRWSSTFTVFRYVKIMLYVHGGYLLFILNERLLSFARLSLICFLCVTNRLPEADDSCREHHSLNVPLPVAARVCSNSACLSPPLPGRPCTISHGPALKWTGWPHQARVAAGGRYSLTPPLCRITRLDWTEQS